MRGLFALFGYCLLGAVCGYAGGALISRAEQGDWFAILESARVRSWLILLAIAAIAGAWLWAFTGVPVAQVVRILRPTAEMLLIPTLIVAIFVRDAHRRYCAGRRLDRGLWSDRTSCNRPPA